jgi:uncharacterized protein YcfJ
MNKQLLVGVGIGIAVAGVIGAVASYRSSSPAKTDSVVAQSLMSKAPVFAEPAPAAESASSSGVSRANASPERARFAEVLASSPVLVTDKVAHEECRDVQVTRQKPVKDQDKIAGTAIGAVVGGVLGNQIGDGKGQTIATVAGAVAGGYAGRKVQDRIQKNATETVTEKQCHTVYDTTQKTDGYRVKVEMDGKVRTLHMKTDPGVGTRIPANDRRLSAS